MSVSSIGSVASSSVLQQLEALNQKTGSNTTASTDSTANTTSATTTDTDAVSGIGKLLSSLHDLATANLTQFKQETSDMATQLTAAASNTTGDASSFLKGLADQFQQASDTGDASALTLKNHSHASSGSSSSSAASQAASQYDESSLFSLLDSSSTSVNSYLSSTQQTLLDSLFSSSTN
jgi:hypothetical protein